MRRQYDFYLTNRDLFVSSTIWFLYGHIPCTGEPVRVSDATSDSEIREHIRSTLASPCVTRLDVHARDHRKGQPFLMSTATKYKSHKSFGKDSVNFTVRQDWENKTWGIYRSIGTAGMDWDIDPRPSGNVALPASATDQEVLEALFRMVIETRENWDAFKA